MVKNRWSGFVVNKRVFSLVEAYTWFRTPDDLSDFEQLNLCGLKVSLQQFANLQKTVRSLVPAEADLQVTRQ